MAARARPVGTTAIAVLLSVEIGALVLLMGAQVIAEYERIGREPIEAPIQTLDIGNLPSDVPQTDERRKMSMTFFSKFCELRKPAAMFFAVGAPRCLCSARSSACSRSG